MTHEPQPARRRRWLRWLIVAAILVVVIPIALLIGYHVYLDHQIAAEYAAIRAAGQPATLAELDASYKFPPAGENAADVILQAAALFVPYKGQGQNPLSFRTERRMTEVAALSSDRLETATAFLTQNAALLDLLHKAATLKGCRLPARLTGLRFGSGMPHWQQTTRVQDLLSLDAQARAQQRDGDGATRSIVTAMKLARLLRLEPDEFQQSMQSAFEDRAAITLALLLTWRSLDEAQLAALQDAFASTDDTEALMRGFAGYRCVWSDFIQSEPAGLYRNVLNDGLADWRAGRFLYKVSGAFKADHLAYLRMSARLMKMYDEPYPQRLAAITQVKKEARRLPSTRLFARQEMQWCGTGESDAAHAAIMRAAQTALAVERFRLANGKLPEGLGELAPKYLMSIPQDPFDGQPLRYKRFARGYVVYSVGRDVRDDGGKPFISEYDVSPQDVTFVVGR